MSALYEHEGLRVDKVSEVLAGYNVRLRLNRKVQGAAYQTDGDMSIDINDRRHPYVIVEFKNETTSSKSEPYVQALMYYLQSTRAEEEGKSLPYLLWLAFSPPNLLSSYSMDLWLAAAPRILAAGCFVLDLHPNLRRWALAGRRRGSLSHIFFGSHSLHPPFCHPTLWTSGSPPLQEFWQPDVSFSTYTLIFVAGA
ncbi:hypothetical protein BDR05DRAFT_1006204 [Suillus weaverae]|nr:hypothetical protein BDR05DRAFT_1006204 [Suillus weaverae]